MKSKHTFLTLFFFISTLYLVAKPRPEKNLKQIEKALLQFQKLAIELNYHECNFRLEHNFSAFQQRRQVLIGNIYSHNQYILQRDRLKGRRMNYASLNHWLFDSLYFMDYGDTIPSILTKEIYNDQKIKLLRYHPMLYLTQEHSHKILTHHNQSKTVDCISGNYFISLFWNSREERFDSAHVKYADPMWGDLINTYHYQYKSNTKEKSIPIQVIIHKQNELMTDTIVFDSCFASKRSNEVPKFKHSTWKQENENPVSIEFKRINSQLSIIELKHTDDRVFCIEFPSYWFVEGAPLNSENGELIVNELKKINPQKPIKYFSFGHWHPHYTGGIRAFVHAGSSILSRKVDSTYINTLIHNPHRYKPDALQKEMKEARIQWLDDSLLVNEGKDSLWIYFIGDQSNHTNDYLIYYLPTYKIVLEDDLVWVPIDKELTKANARQEGFYQSILKHGLDVKEVYQSWPVKAYGVKTIIPFDDIKKSVEMIKN